MKVLAVVGSPRRGGNTDTLIDKAIEGAKNLGADVEKIYLADLNIVPCDACLACSSSGVCVHDDDMRGLYPKIRGAGAIIIGTPVYWWGPSAQLKLFIDRWYALLAKREELRGKKIGVIAAYGDEDARTARHIFGMFEDISDYLGLELVGTVGATANDPGEVAQNEPAMKRALFLGRLIGAI